MYIVDDNILKRKSITIAWQSDDVAVIKAGLDANELLVLTPLGQVTSGTIVSLNSIDGKPVKASKPTRVKPSADKKSDISSKPRPNAKQSRDEQGAKS